MSRIQGGGAELAVFTPIGVYLSSRVRYSWSCAARVPLSPLHKGVGGDILLAWSCRGPLVVADQVGEVVQQTSTSKYHIIRSSYVGSTFLFGST